MEFLSHTILIFNLINIPLYLYRRIRKNKKNAFLNPCLYLLIGSYFYFTLSSLLFEIRPLEMGYLLFNLLNFEEESIFITSLISNWFVLIFFIFYILSKDIKLTLNYNYKPKKITTQIAFFLILIIFIYFVFLITIFGPQLINSSFSEAREFLRILITQYRYKVVVTVLVVSVMVLLWRTKKLNWYLYLIFPIIIDVLTRSRGRILFIVISSYINYVAIFGKTRLHVISFIIVGVLSIFFLRRIPSINSMSDIFSIPLALLGEVFNTRATTVIIYDRFLGEFPLHDYIMFCFLNVLPNQLSHSLFPIIWSNPEETMNLINYQEYIRNYYESQGITWGLAGNIVSEALYFGGIPFAIVSPFIIGGLFYVFNEFTLHKTFPSFIFFTLLVSQLPRNILRNSFYDTFITLFYIMATYLIWLSILEARKIILHKTSR